jgi:hypothetical protein
MKKPERLSWENLLSIIIVNGEQRAESLSLSPAIQIFFDGHKHELGILIECKAESKVPPELSALRAVAARVVRMDGRDFLQMTTRLPPLYRQFYFFAIAVAERVLAENIPGPDAAVTEIRCFGDLFDEQTVLSAERQIGLTGELIFLCILLDLFGNQAVDAWLGPLGEPHDFRISGREFEIKTTVATSRIHTINGLEQALPSAGCTLWITSVLLGPPGANAGFSLPGKIAEISARLSGDNYHLTRFEAALAASGYRSDDANRYARRYALRKQPGFVLVDEHFPALTRAVITDILGDKSARIQSAHYSVNLDGLAIVEQGQVFGERAAGGTNDN